MGGDYHPVRAIIGQDFNNNGLCLCNTLRGALKALRIEPIIHSRHTRTASRMHVRHRGVRFLAQGRKDTP